jgi:hypothetical protein
VSTRSATPNAKRVIAHDTRPNNQRLWFATGGQPTGEP